QGEDRVLSVDEDEVVAGRLRDARDIAGPREAHVHAERDPARLHHLFQWIREDRRVCHGFLLVGGVYRYRSAGGPLSSPLPRAGGPRRGGRRSPRGASPRAAWSPSARRGGSR